MFCTPAVSNSSAARLETKYVVARPLLEYHQLKCIVTPMGSVGVFRILTRLCVQKSKVASAIVDEALALWTERLSECPDLSEETRAFLRPQKRVRREENSGYQDVQLALFKNNKEAERRVEDTERRAETRQLALIDTFQLALAQNNKDADRRVEDTERRAETRQLALFGTFQLALAQNNKEAERQARVMQLALGQQIQQVTHSLSLKVSSLCQGLLEKILSPQSAFVNALRKAVKKPSTKKSVDEAKYPGWQMATPEQLMDWPLSCNATL
jgi:hypothetical protein